MIHVPVFFLQVLRLRPRRVDLCQLLSSTCLRTLPRTCYTTKSRGNGLKKAREDKLAVQCFAPFQNLPRKPVRQILQRGSALCDPRESRTLAGVQS